MNENKGIMTVMFKHKHIQKRVRFRFLLIALIMDDNLSRFCRLVCTKRPVLNRNQSRETRRVCLDVPLEVRING